MSSSPSSSPPSPTAHQDSHKDYDGENNAHQELSETQSNSQDHHISPQGHLSEENIEDDLNQAEADSHDHHNVTPHIHHLNHDNATDVINVSEEESNDSNTSSETSSKSLKDAQSYFSPVKDSDVEESRDSLSERECDTADEQTSSNSSSEQDTQETRPTIKLGNYEHLNKKYKLEDPLTKDVVKTSKFETLFMILSFALQEGLSDVGIGLLLKLINQIFGQEVIPASLKIFRSLFDCDIGVSYHFYCPKYKCYLGAFSKLKEKGNQFVCPVSKCKRVGKLSNMNDGNFFISLPLETQLRVFLESKRNIKELLSYRFSREQSVNTIRDVFDGDHYRNLSGLEGILSKEYNLSVTLATDGSPVWESVANTLWPIQCRINELPPKCRFQSDNMFVCGVWFGKEEYVMNVFLSQYVKESNLLHERGFEWTLDGGTVNSKVVTLNCCLDSRAKPDVQCHKQLHSYDGCSYCYHPGNLVNLERNTLVCQEDSDSQEDNSGETENEEVGERKKPETKAVRFPVSTGGFHVERKDGDMREDMTKSTADGKVHRGIKGTSVMTMVPTFNIVTGFVIDYMHCISLGVTKTCLHLWLDKKRSKEPYYIRNSLDEINKSLLVTAMGILLSDCITFEDLDRAKGYLDLFGTDFENLYGVAFMVHNVQITCHLPMIVKMHGPSWSHSAWGFESGNGVLVNLVKGTVGVMSQISRKYMTYRVIIRGTVYQSSNYPKQGKKSYDSAVKLQDGTCAIIERVIIHSKKVYVILRNLIVEHNVYISKHDRIGAKCTHIKVCGLYPFGNLRVERANNIVAKCVLLTCDRLRTYIAESPNNYETD
ncbi:hypothetical protein ONE63_007323 [Megalurothrips usitatus]|uniref:Uncharacterized protein n=1 Tax=Megalurothrips usitatus TaxID=439358 RepID=A0AAV7XUB9_9NEOP|nr:hypothetical protein ONE63_007323 [Megalurothrips usitatus]